MCIPLVITVVGAFIGVWLGLFYGRRESRRKFVEERADILKALLYSLRENHKYIEQIEVLHFPQGQLPTFPLDTVALAHVSLNARRYLPVGTNWAERYNKLRFELDHINRKILIYFITPSQNGFDGLLELIETTKVLLKDEINTLSKITK